MLKLPDGFRAVRTAGSGVALLLGAGGDGRPDAFGPLLSTLAACPLRNIAIQHDKADRLFRQIIGWLKTRRGDKSKIRDPILAEAFGHVFDGLLFRVIQAQSFFEEFIHE